MTSLDPIGRNEDVDLINHLRTFPNIGEFASDSRAQLSREKSSATLKREPSETISTVLPGSPKGNSTDGHRRFTSTQFNKDGRVTTTVKRSSTPAAQYVTSTADAYRRLQRATMPP